LKRLRFILYIFVLVLSLITFGNYIHKRSTLKKKNINTSNIVYKSDYIIQIEVDSKTLYLVDAKTLEIDETYTIATGKTGSPTPLGAFNIVKKDEWGEGFGGRWIGLDVPWGIYGIHGTNKPGSIGLNVSAGCVRMRNENIKKVYDKIDVGTKVIITNGPYGPFGNGFRTLKPGDRGADVMEVQKRLKNRGFYEGSLDGIYGEGMKKSLIDFSKSENIEPTDKVSPNIYAKLGIVLMD